MLELIKGQYAYIFLMLLFVIGLYAMMMKKKPDEKGYGDVHAPERHHTHLDSVRI
ncbi:MAG: hypothetical protein ACOCV7_05170 [Desulfonatronovibrionaceae bacterium]